MWYMFNSLAISYMMMLLASHFAKLRAGLVQSQFLPNQNEGMAKILALIWLIVKNWLTTLVALTLASFYWQAWLAAILVGQKLVLTNQALKTARNISSFIINIALEN